MIGHRNRGSFVLGRQVLPGTTRDSSTGSQYKKSRVIRGELILFPLFRKYESYFRASDSILMPWKLFSAPTPPLEGYSFSPTTNERIYRCSPAGVVLPPNLRSIIWVLCEKWNWTRNGFSFFSIFSDNNENMYYSSCKRESVVWRILNVQYQKTVRAFNNFKMNFMSKKIIYFSCFFMIRVKIWYMDVSSICRKDLKLFRTKQLVFCIQSFGSCTRHIWFQREMALS